jgi:hypothetical protein
MPSAQILAPRLPPNVTSEPADKASLNQTSGVRRGSTFEPRERFSTYDLAGSNVHDRLKSDREHISRKNSLEPLAHLVRFGAKGPAQGLAVPDLTGGACMLVQRPFPTQLYEAFFRDIHLGPPQYCVKKWHLHPCIQVARPTDDGAERPEESSAGLGRQR